MVRRRPGERGIDFSVRVCDSGYAWQLDSDNHCVLAPVGWWQEGRPGIEPGTITKSGLPFTFVRRYGLDIARKAFNAFRTLANALEATTVREIAVVEGRTVNGTEAWELLTAIKSDRRDLIGIYSQRYGSLWGYAEYHKLGAWMSEAGEFLDLHDVAQMITPRGSPQDFENRVKRNSIGISYRGVRPHSLPMFIPGWNRTHFNPRDLLLNEISKKLEGGFSLDGRYDSGNSANITPTHLIHLLYLRMWLDVIDAKPLERECVVCGEAIEGKNRNRKYCGYACRQRHYRRRHAQRQ